MVELKRRLNRTDLLAITLGAVIGIGVFRNTGVVLRGAGGFVEATVLWVLIGFLCLSGVSLYADLSSRVPEVGGQYAYVREAFGRRAAFVYGWMKAGVSIPARQAAVVAASGELMAKLIPMSQRSLAIALLLVLAVLHLGGVRTGAIAQRIFTVGKLLTILFVIGLSVAVGWRAPTEEVTVVPVSFAAAVGAVWYTYLAWQDSVVLAEEVHEPRRTLPFVMYCTVVICIILYITLHIAVYLGLGGSAEAYGDVPALALARNALGEHGEVVLLGLLISSMIGVSAIGVLLRPRAALALARDGLGPKVLTEVSSVGTPYVALAFHVVVSLGFLLTGRYVELLKLISFATGVMGLFEIASYFVVRRKRPEWPTSRLHPWGPLGFLFMATALCALAAWDNPISIVYSVGIISAMATVHYATRGKHSVPNVL